MSIPKIFASEDQILKGHSVRIVEENGYLKIPLRYLQMAELGSAGNKAHICIKANQGKKHVHYNIIISSQKRYLPMQCRRKQQELRTCERCGKGEAESIPITANECWDLCVDCQAKLLEALYFHGYKMEKRQGGKMRRKPLPDMTGIHPTSRETEDL